MLFCEGECFSDRSTRTLERVSAKGASADQRNDLLRAELAAQHGVYNDRVTGRFSTRPDGLTVPLATFQGPQVVPN